MKIIEQCNNRTEGGKMTNFEKITASPEALAEALVSLWVMGSRSFPSFVWLGIKDNENYEAFNKRTVAISATLEWLEKEVEK